MKVFASYLSLLWLVATVADPRNPTLLNRASSSSIAKPRDSLRKQRKLQDESPCAMPYEEALAVGQTFKPSYLGACVRSLEIDPLLMAQHIEALRKIFEDYFCFYNIANDAAASSPFEYGKELGYTLFLGEDEGQVNLEQELTELYDKVLTEGASVGNFWDIQEIFNKAYDAHIYPFQIAGDAGIYSKPVILVVSTSALDSGIMPQALHPQYNSDGELELGITFMMDDGSLKEDAILSINGMTPFEFYYSLVTNPALGATWPYQSIGARMNGAFKGLQPLSGVPFVMSFEGVLSPDFLPDSFPVVYASGEEDTFVTAATYVAANATTAYDFFNSNPDFLEAGPAFLNYAIALLTVQNVTAADVKQLMPTPKPKTPEPQTRAGHGDHKKSYEFDGVFTSVFVGEVGGFKITDEYAVFKLTDFQVLVNDRGFEIVEMWANFTAAAKARGVKKAIVDISGNGGG